MNTRICRERLEILLLCRVGAGWNSVQVGRLDLGICDGSRREVIFLIS